MKPTALVTENTRFRKSASGRIGSTTRDSTSKKATSESVPPTISPIILGALQE